MHVFSHMASHLSTPPLLSLSLSIILSELHLSIKRRPLDLYYTKRSMEKLPVDCKHTFQQVACLLGPSVCPGEAAAPSKVILDIWFYAP